MTNVLKYLPQPALEITMEEQGMSKWRVPSAEPTLEGQLARCKEIEWVNRGIAQ